MSKKTTKCVLYARFSPRPKEALDNCQSAGQQLAECRVYAERMGYQVMNSFVDEGKSRDDFDREGIFDAIQQAKRGWKIIAVRPDRVGSGQAYAVIDYQIRKMGARLEYASGDYNGDDPALVLVRNIMSHVAEYERAMVGARTSAGMRYRQNKGERMTRADALPYGMALDPDDPDRMVPHPAEQRAIRSIRKWYTKDGKTIAEIVRMLNATTRYPPRGKRWHRNSVRRILDRAKAA